MKLLDRLLTRSGPAEQHRDVETIMEILSGVALDEVGSTYMSVAKHGYKGNPTIRRAIDIIANAIGSLKWHLVDPDGNSVGDHELLDLIRHPAPTKGAAQFFNTMQIQKLLGGQTYIRGIFDGNGNPSELQLLRPDRVSVIEGVYTDIKEYSYVDNNRSLHFPVDPVTSRSAIFRNYYYDPILDAQGCSPVVTVMKDVALLNAGTDHNRAMLKNRGVPSALITYVQEVGEETRLRLEAQFKEKFSGKNAGRPIVTDGTSLQYNSLAQNNLELDFVNSATMSQKAIALGMGIPLPLIVATGAGITDMEASNLQLYTQTILPEADRLAAGLSDWLTYHYPELHGHELQYDKDAIDALEPLRRERFKKVAVAQWLTINEQRTETGFPELEGDEYDKPIITGVSTQEEAVKPAPGSTITEQEGSDQTTEDASREDSQ